MLGSLKVYGCWTYPQNKRSPACFASRLPSTSASRSSAIFSHCFILRDEAIEVAVCSGAASTSVVLIVFEPLVSLITRLRGGMNNTGITNIPALPKYHYVKNVIFLAFFEM
jgi:hypothetical protein